jgi:hypothetical protein
MLGACALKNRKSWDKCIPYAEFSYNNSYQKSLKMSPFEVLYGSKCQTPLFWNEPRENQVFGPEILREAKRQVQVVRENLKLAQSRQKSYADHRRRKLSFQVSDFVYLKVSPMRGLHQDILDRSRFWSKEVKQHISSSYHHDYRMCMMSFMFRN